MQKKYFAKYKEPFIPLPNLVEIQLNSFKWFLKEGLKELFQEFSPINDYAGKEFFLEFLDYSIDEPKVYDTAKYFSDLKGMVRLFKKSLNLLFQRETPSRSIFL